MKRIVEVEIPDGPQCGMCPFLLWYNGGFDQRCALYGDSNLRTGRTNEEDPSTYGTFKCNNCLGDNNA